MHFLHFMEKIRTCTNSDLYYMRVCQNTLLITENRYIAELSYEVAILAIFICL